MFCSKCGAPISENSIFCEKCGQRINANFQNDYSQQPAALSQHDITGLGSYFKSVKFKSLFIAFMALSGAILTILLAVPYYIFKAFKESYNIWLIGDNSYPKILNDVLARFLNKDSANIETALILIFVISMVFLVGMIVTMALEKFTASLVISWSNLIWFVVSLCVSLIFFEKTQLTFNLANAGDFSGIPVGTVICIVLALAAAMVSSIIWRYTRKTKNNYQSRRSFALKTSDLQIIKLRKTLTVLSVLVIVISIWSIFLAVGNYFSLINFFNERNKWEWSEYTHIYNNAHLIAFDEKVKSIIYTLFSVITIILCLFGNRSRHFGFFIPMILTICVTPVRNYNAAHPIYIITLIVGAAVTVAALAVSLMLNKKYNKALTHNIAAAIDP